MRRAQRRKYHYLYKTTCKVTGKYYYGMHSTDNLNDGYIGSGQRLWKSINKYGRENHEIEKLEFFESREKLKEAEAELVNEELLLDSMCMNLARGGEGGVLSIEGSIKGGKMRAAKIKELFENEEWRKNFSRSVKQGIKDKKRKSSNGMLGKSHSKETKEKMSNSHKGLNNSQYGTCWITNGKENKKIHRGDDIPNGYRLGRKI